MSDIINQYKKEIIKLKEQLRKQEEKSYEYEYILDNIPANVYWKDSEGKFLGCNKQVIDVYQLDNKTKIIGINDSALPWNKSVEFIKENDNKVLICDATQEFEENIHIDGKNLIFLNHKSPLKDKNNKTYGIIGVAVDITDRKKLEDELVVKKNQLEKKLAYQQAYIKSYGYDYVNALKVISNAMERIDERLSCLDYKPNVRRELNREFYDINESLSEIYNLYQKINASILEQEEQDRENILPMKLENIMKNEVDLANASIGIQYKNKAILKIDEEVNLELYVDIYKLRHILRTLFANFTKSISFENNKDIYLYISSEGISDQKLEVKFSFDGTIPYMDLYNNEIRAEGIVTDINMEASINHHDFSYEMSKAKYYLEKLQTGDVKIDCPFEGSSFSFSIPFRRVNKNSDIKKQRFQPTIVK